MQFVDVQCGCAHTLERISSILFAFVLELEYMSFRLSSFEKFNRIFLNLNVFTYKILGYFTICYRETGGDKRMFSITGFV